jgi:hypothetical protein
MEDLFGQSKVRLSRETGLNAAQNSQSAIIDNSNNTGHSALR